MKRRIRHAESTDFETLLRIDRSCFPEDTSFSATDLGYYLDRSSSMILVAEEGDQTVGFVVLDMSEPRITATLVTLDVIDRFRRAGVGSLLLRRSERLLAENGAIQLELQVDITNAPAISFYQVHSFRIRETLPHYYGRGRDAYLMTKELGVEQSRSDET